MFTLNCISVTSEKVLLFVWKAPEVKAKGLLKMFIFKLGKTLFLLLLAIRAECNGFVLYVRH